MGVPELERITLDPNIMGGKPCIRGKRVTVGAILDLLSSGTSRSGILELYPYLEKQDLDAAIAYGAWRVEEKEIPLTVGQ